jgi:hypothetical protein
MVLRALTQMIVEVSVAPSDSSRKHNVSFFVSTHHRFGFLGRGKAIHIMLDVGRACIPTMVDAYQRRLDFTSTSYYESYA